MKRHRNAFLLLAALIIVISGLLCGATWLLMQLRTQTFCPSSPSLQMVCKPGQFGGLGWLIGAICVLGGLITLSFLWLAWQESLILKQRHLDQARQHIFEVTQLLVVTKRDPPPGDD